MHQTIHISKCLAMVMTGTIVFAAAVASASPRPQKPAFSTDPAGKMAVVENGRSVAPNLMWRPNTGSPVGWQQGLPDVPFKKTIDDFKFVAERNCIGIYIDKVWEHWATQGPLYYVMAQLTWDPEQSGEAVLEDYYRRGFGPAADELKQYWTLLENTREKVKETDLSMRDGYNDDFFAEAYALLDRAAEKTSGKESERVAFMRAGLDYTRLYMENLNVMRKYRESGADTEVAEKSRQLWEEMKTIATSDEFPYAINWGPIRPQTGRGGPHPDHM